MITLHAAFYNIDAVLCPGEEELNALVMQEVWLPYIHHFLLKKIESLTS